MAYVNYYILFANFQGLISRDYPWNREISVDDVIDIVERASYSEQQAIINETWGRPYNDAYNKAGERGNNYRSTKLNAVLNGLDSLLIDSSVPGGDKFQKSLTEAQNSEDTTIRDLRALYLERLEQIISHHKTTAESYYQLYDDIVSGRAATYTGPKSNED